MGTQRARVKHMLTAGAAMLNLKATLRQRLRKLRVRAGAVKDRIA